MGGITPTPLQCTRARVTMGDLKEKTSIDVEACQRTVHLKPQAGHHLSSRQKALSASPPATAPFHF